MRVVRGSGRVLFEMAHVCHLLCVFLGEKVLEVVKLAFEHLVLGSQRSIVKLQFVVLFDHTVVRVLKQVGFCFFLGSRLFGRFSVL